MQRALLAALLALPLTAAAQAKWDMATAYADTEFQTKNVRQWAEEVQKASAGKISITVHSGQSLIKNPEIKRSVQTGLVPAGEFFMSNIGPENALFEVDAIPFFASGYPEARALWDVSRAPIAALFEKQGLRMLFSVPWPSQAFFTKEPVKSLADIKGKKMRTYNAQTARLGTLMGVIPTTVQATEIPQAFSTGIIDLMFTSTPTGVTTRAWEYTKFFYDTGAWVPKNVVIVNAGAFGKLPADVQKAITDTAAATEKRGWEWSEQENDQRRADLGKNGLKIEPITPQFKAELKKIGDTMLNDWLAKAGDDGKKVVAEYRKKVPN
jgi:TRAP-type transport system periplasmic protein